MKLEKMEKFVLENYMVDHTVEKINKIIIHDFYDVREYV